MTEPADTPTPVTTRQNGSATRYGAGDRPQPTNLADLLERVLDKGVVLAGDIRVNLLDIELLTIKIRLLLVSVDKAEEMGIDWWRTDPMLSSQAKREQDALQQENAELRERLEAWDRPAAASDGIAALNEENVSAVEGRRDG
ncbi:gas vesicle protein [Microlunatus soli]|nr:gas vesicle protein [Microlunatus soli]